MQTFPDSSYRQNDRDRQSIISNRLYNYQFKFKDMKTEQFVEAYEAPQVEIIEVAVEKGFASSDPWAVEVTGEGADSNYGVY